MVRNYIRKTNRGQQYSKDTLKKAVNKISKGCCTINGASERFGIHGVKSSGQGRSTAIPYEQENKRAQVLKALEKWGNEVLDTIATFVKRNSLETPFKYSRPNEDWFLAFKKKPQSLEYARKKAAADPFLVENYFVILAQITTILLGGNVDGDKLPPLIILKRSNVWDTWMPHEEEFPEISCAASANGWMESDIFLNYFKKSFLSNCVPERQTLLIYGGRCTHLDQHTLPPHTSHLFQLMDLTVFRSLKTKWEIKLPYHQIHNAGQKVIKKYFSSLVCSVWKEASPELLRSGFKAGGIHPYDRNVIAKNQYDPQTYRHQEQTNKDQSEKNEVKKESRLEKIQAENETSHQPQERMKLEKNQDE
ncbi:hypothetical protein PR048_008636 [Dryococelus australis]|uniref:DDE-1 domain-containing protein n=1 Tax=Dryococelus australis TaxID=614101 RepID=A0ABQ9HXN8_9NEOP|nr:hypothetical protein PR048_008636 [Dryococelus australis]